MPLCAAELEAACADANLLIFARIAAIAAAIAVACAGQANARPYPAYPVPTHVRYPTPSPAEVKATCVRRGSEGRLVMWSYSNRYLLCDVDYNAYDGELLFERRVDGSFRHMNAGNDGKGGINFDGVQIPDSVKEDLRYHEIWPLY